MTTTYRQAHWENIYTTKGESEVSWFEETPTESLQLLELAGAQPASAIVDVGGGASRLVDNLLEKGFENITVLDLSAAALNSARARTRRQSRCGEVDCRRCDGMAADRNL